MKWTDIVVTGKICLFFIWSIGSSIFTGSYAQTVEREFAFSVIGNVSSNRDTNTRGTPIGISPPQSGQFASLTKITITYSLSIRDSAVASFRTGLAGRTDGLFTLRIGGATKEVDSAAAFATCSRGTFGITCFDDTIRKSGTTDFEFISEIDDPPINTIIPEITLINNPLETRSIGRATFSGTINVLQVFEEGCFSADPCIQKRYDSVLDRCLTDDGRSFNKDFWNDGERENSIRRSNNCYAYAMNRYTPSGGRGAFLRPGEGNNLDVEITCEDMTRGAESDGLNKQPNCNTSCSSGGRKVALAVAEKSKNDGEEDYHWYREDRPGEWSHKRGEGKATNLDSKNIVIEDPVTANKIYLSPRTNKNIEYEFCSCFCTKPACDEILDSREL